MLIYLYFHGYGRLFEGMGRKRISPKTITVNQLVVGSIPTAGANFPFFLNALLATPAV
jgi:hypothetical protein